MSKSQIIALLKEGATGVLVADICRKYGIANSTYYKEYAASAAGPASL